MSNGDASKFILPGLASLGGLAVGVVSMVAFLYGQFYTLREHEEFRHTMEVTQDKANDHMKRMDQMIIDNQKAIAEAWGFINAHRAAGK